MAWTRRKRFEAKLLAVELAAVMGMGTGMVSNGRSGHTAQRGGERVHADKLLGEMGITI